MQQQIDLLSRLSDLALSPFTLFYLSFGHLSLDHTSSSLTVKSQYLSISSCLKQSPPVCWSEESWFESARDSGSCLSRVYFLARSMSLIAPLETQYRFAFSTFVSVCVARGMEYSTRFILVVAGSPRRAMADNS